MRSHSFLLWRGLAQSFQLVNRKVIVRHCTVSWVSQYCCTFTIKKVRELLFSSSVLFTTWLLANNESPSLCTRSIQYDAINSLHGLILIYIQMILKNTGDETMGTRNKTLQRQKCLCVWCRGGRG